MDDRFFKNESLIYVKKTLKLIPIIIVLERLNVIKIPLALLTDVLFYIERTISKMLIKN